MQFSSLPAIELALLALLLMGFIAQAWFLLVRVLPLALFKKRDASTRFSEPVSVIICAKNEAENLEKNIPAIMAQSYDNYEVIVVNDCSEDDSEIVLARLKERYPKLYYTSIPVDKKFFHGKKLALTIGVKAAKSNYLLFTDADCRPVSDSWLSAMVNGFSSPGIEIVLGFGGYEKGRGFVNHLVLYDTFFAAIQYLGFALSKNPYMGVGRNLAYTKSLFTNNNGLKSHLNLQSGDDDLFIQETANVSNTATVIHREAQTLSSPPLTLSDWRIQKSRHLSTTPRYKLSLKAELFMEPFSRLIFWLSAIGLIIFNNFAIIAIGAILLKWIFQLVLWRLIAKKLEQGKIYLGMFWFELIHPLLLAWAYSGNLFNLRKNKWK